MALQVADVWITFSIGIMQILKICKFLTKKKLTLIVFFLTTTKQMFVVPSAALVPRHLRDVSLSVSAHTRRVFARPHRICVAWL